MSRPLRVGVVDYLNSRPLAWDFLRGNAPPGFSAGYHPPAEVADRLRAGRLDIGLIPSIEVQRIPGLSVLAGPCVAAQREVRSVLLVSTVTPSAIRRVALDRNSRTSAALLTILLGEQFGVSPEFTPRKPDLRAMLADADAALIIGDPALGVETGSLQVLDLAQEWRRLTGLPFVFAVWAVRSEVRKEGLSRVFANSLQHGLSELETIARQAAQELDLDVDHLLHYLTQNLSYELGHAERRSLDEFYRRAVTWGQLEAIRPLEFLDD
jgi:chorismate dehydratase